MTREEAIWYLQPIADSASLPRYAEALNMAIAALREQTVTNCNELSAKDKMLESNRVCSGCRWKGVRPQRCSCCRRNIYMKDGYEPQEEA